MYKIPDEAKFLSRVNDMLVMEAGDELWLASGTPRYWLEPGKKICLHRAATRFGRISYELRHGDAPGIIQADIDPLFKEFPGKMKLYIRTPWEKQIRSVIINGKEWDKFDKIKGIIFLPVQKDTMQVLVHY
jgi:hypothetical protein